LRPILIPNLGDRSQCLPVSLLEKHICHSRL